MTRKSIKSVQVKRPKKALEDAVKALSGAKTRTKIMKCANEVLRLAADKPFLKRTSPKYGRFLKAAPDLKGRIVTRFYQDSTLDFYITDVKVVQKQVDLYGIFFSDRFTMMSGRASIMPDVVMHLLPESVTFDNGNMYWNRQECFIDTPMAFDRVNKPLSWLMNCFYSNGKNRVISRKKKPFKY